MFVKLFRPYVAVLASLFLLNPLAHAAGDRVPAKGSYVSYELERETIGDPGNFGVPFARVVTEGEGVASHYGRFSIRSEYLVYLTFLDGVLAFVFEGTSVTTTANGSIGHGVFRGVRVLGETTFTVESWWDSGGHFFDEGEVLEDGSSRIVSTGTLPNPGRGRNK